ASSLDFIQIGFFDHTGPLRQLQACAEVTSRWVWTRYFAIWRTIRGQVRFPVDDLGTAYLVAKFYLSVISTQHAKMCVKGKARAGKRQRREHDPDEKLQSSIPASGVRQRNSLILLPTP